MPLPATQDELQTLAFEVAFCYYTPEQLSQRYDIEPEQLEALTREPRFRRLVLKAEREIDEAGTHMKVAARKLVNSLVPSIANIANDPTQSPSDRLAAFKQLVSIAGVATDASSVGGGGGFQINLNIQTASAEVTHARTIEDDG